MPPAVSVSALQTIRGTIKVIVRLRVDPSDAVVNAAAGVPDPSRYFERKLLAAVKQWLFWLIDSAEQRTMRVQFSYTRIEATVELLPEKTR